MPKVSVIIPCYQHEKYVATTITSVLNQSFQDFEVLITDDGSTDACVDIINEFKDERINLCTFPSNRGAAFAANNALQRATGDFIAVLNSDDLWAPQKLEVQLNFLENNTSTSAVFALPFFIDEDGRSLINHPWTRLFVQGEANRFWWLRQFFYLGNALCHPTAMVRKEVYDILGGYDPRYPQLSDFDLWVRLASRYNFTVLSEKLTGFRILDSEKNTSAHTPSVLIRDAWEFEQILSNYLNLGEDTYRSTFLSELTALDLLDMPRSVSLGWICVNSPRKSNRIFGLRLLHDALGRNLPGIDAKSLSTLVTTIDPYNFRI